MKPRGVYANSESLVSDMGHSPRSICSVASNYSVCPFSFYSDVSNFLDLESVPERTYIVAEIISKLQNILQWFSNQERIKFYSSSILIAFDGEKTHYTDYLKSFRHEASCQGNDIIHRESDLARRGSDVAISKGDLIVRMIDFPHTYIDLKGEKSLDSNYIYGLKNLIRIFECLEPVCR